MTTTIDTNASSSLLDEIIAASTPERTAMLATRKPEDDIPAAIKAEATEAARKAYQDRKSVV